MAHSKRLPLILGFAVAGVVLLGYWATTLKAFPSSVFVAPPVFQRIETKLEEKAEIFENSVYIDDSQSKLASGVANVLVGWNDLIIEPERALANDENLLKGVGKGIVDAFANTTGGLLRVLTFPIPHLHIPLPEDGVEL